MKKYRYGVLLRPADSFSLPEGWERGEAEAGERSFPFGVIEYDHPLTSGQEKRFDLEPLDPHHLKNIRKRFNAARKTATELLFNPGYYKTKSGGLVAPDPHGGFDKWRVTFFDGEEPEEPTGHMVFNDMSEAVDFVAGELMRTP